MENEKIQERHLSRSAYVYIRQSTSYQAEHNLESQKRQYQLVDKAKALGFTDVKVIDEDMGLSAAGYSQRSGFNKLVAEVGLNQVGIVFGLEVSRFARNNRDWHHLVDLCALFDTLIADQDGVYQPNNPNDRMLLGLKGTISEVEINILKGRMLEGARNKAKRGELVYRLPIGFMKTEDQKIEKDPDERVQNSIGRVFSRFRESRSVRQTFLWFVQEKVVFPSIEYGRFGREVVWKVPVYNTIYHVLKNPTYAGAYVYGMRETKKCFVDNEIKKRRTPLDMKNWKVLIKDNHLGYISWEEYIKNQAVMQENHKKTRGSRGPILKGTSVLAGLLRCKPCGRKLMVAYGGKNGDVPQYSCRSGRLHRGEKDCIAFGGVRVDEAVSREVLRVVEPFAIDASLKAIEDFNKDIDEHKKMIELELEDAEYEVQRAYRQYNKVEPENRLVRPQLESKWNSNLEEVDKLKDKLNKLSTSVPPLNDGDKEEMLTLSEDLPALWESSSTTKEMRKKIIRSVIEEIIADVDIGKSIIQLTIHWMGGIHTKIEVKKNRSGEHGRVTDKSTVELIRQMASQLTDKAIAPILNRLKLKTGCGNNWTRDRVKVLRSYNKIPAYNAKKETDKITLEQAARKLGVCDQSVKSLIKKGAISAKQIVPYAPWLIPVQELKREEVENAVKKIKNGLNRKKNVPWRKDQMNLFQ